MTFSKWLDTFVAEKGLDLEHTFLVDGADWGENHIPLACVIDYIKQVPADVQAKIKTTFVKIDFANGEDMVED